jgi:putative membrane protein
MIRFILRALVAAAGLWVASLLLHGRGVVVGPDWQSLVVAGVVLGVVNAVVRPIITFLTLPATILTLGLFLLLVNGLMVFVTSWVLNHFLHMHMHIGGWLNAVLVVVIVWAVSLVGNMFLADEERPRSNRR